MDKFRCRLREQFQQRANFFEASANWVKNENLLNIHKELAGSDRQNLILDSCCGTGVVGHSLLHNGSKVIGLDISLPMLKKARERLHFCINGDIEHFPFLDGIFDVVICRQAFHFFDINQAMKELYRITRPKGGKIIISQIVPFGKEDSDWLQKIHKKKQLLLKNFLCEADLKTLLCNFGCVDIVSQHCCVEESVNNWLKDTFFPPEAIKDIKDMFLNAPPEYKNSHRVKIVNGDVIDTMKWVIIRGTKM